MNYCINKMITQFLRDKAKAKLFPTNVYTSLGTFVGLMSCCCPARVEHLKGFVNLILSLDKRNLNLGIDSSFQLKTLVDSLMMNAFCD